MYYIYTAAAAAKSHQSCPTLSNPMDHSLPGSSIHGILQARLLEWVATAFSMYTLYMYDTYNIHAFILSCHILIVLSVIPHLYLFQHFL